MRYLIAPVMMACLAGSVSLAAEPAAPAPAAAAAAAAKDEVPALIRQLGDDSPKVRDEASQKLRRLGQVAMPALTEAQKSDDPEVSSRAQAVARQIEEDGKPTPDGAGGGNLDPRSRMLLDMARMRMRGGGAVAGGGGGRAVREVNTVDGGKRIRIREDAKGITVTTVEKTADGAEVTKTTEVRDAAALRREFPEVYPLYEKHLGALRPAGLDARIEPLDAAGNADVDRLLREARRMIDEQRPMIEAQRRLADEQLREARRQLDAEMRRLREEQRK
jgi:hypothetical protein